MSATILTGFHAIAEYLKTPQENDVLLVGPKPGPRVKDLMQTARDKGLKIEVCRSSDLDRLACAGTHRGAALRLAQGTVRVHRQSDLHEVLTELTTEEDRAKSRMPLIVALDSVTDPHNLGAILRSADKLAVDLVVLPERRSAQENETVLRSSAGAAAHVRIAVVNNLSRALHVCKEAGFWVVGADMGGTPADEFDADRPLVLVMGSEGKGLGRLVRETCDEVVSIPATGHVDSFNVSVAAGILLYELRRQQHFPW